jgi:hypothetical protein
MKKYPTYLKNKIFPEGEEGDMWDCGHHHMCRDESKIVFAWAKHAPPTTLPEEVGFALEKDDHLILQVNIYSIHLWRLT